MQKSGLLDTMSDLIIDAAGAFVASMTGYFYLKAGDFFIYALQQVRKAKAEKGISLKSPVKKIIAKGKISKEDFEKIKADLIATTSAEEIVFENIAEESKIDYEVVVDI